MAHSMSDVTLELCCGRCNVRLMRWTIDADQPFDRQRLEGWVNGKGTVRHNSPGTLYPGSDGGWYRWTPGASDGDFHAWTPGVEVPEDEVYFRTEFRCPNGCRTNPQVRSNKLDAAVRAALRHLHDTRKPLLRTTVDTLLKFAA
jgi:hypothetical protein